MANLDQSEGIDYSLVICAYNPDDGIFKRCLKAVGLLDRTGITTETIIVDNNSQPPLNGPALIAEYSSSIPNLRIITEQRQGVQYARIAAIKAARGWRLVYFDYDNEPDPAYLQELKKLNDQHPEIGALGPGDVTVEFTGDVDPMLREYAKSAFQERHEHSLQFATEKEWQPCYPFGTGLCSYRTVLEKYVQLAASGILTLKGRHGKRLSSGEDTQMVLLAIRSGYAAGVAPQLRLRHLVPSARVSVPYLKRLAYGTSVCYATCLLQVFPDRKQLLHDRLLTPGRFVRRSLKKWIVATLSRSAFKTFELAHYIGLNEGVYRALGKEVPRPVKWLGNYMKLE
jgi:glycosyltransferase involved in cell wall biosynthesis